MVFCLIAPVYAQASAAESMDVATAIQKRVAEARKNGYWVVGEGEHLYRIARYFYPEDRARIERLREFLIQRNSHAFMSGKPSLLIVGARLFLPPDLTAAGAAPNAQTLPAAPVATAPSGSTQPVEPVKAPESVTSAAPSSQTRITPVDPSASVTERQVVMPAIPAYVDKLIDGAVAEDAPVASAQPVDETPGRRTVSIGYTHASRDRSGAGSSRDQGIDLRLTRETENYGDFRLDAQWTQFSPAAMDLLPTRKSLNATLYHTQLPLPGGLTADSAAGVVRSLQPLWFASSYRVVLPSTLLSGVQTRIGGDRGELRFSAGEPGRLAGIGILDFERTSGRYASLSGSYLITPALQIGGGITRLTDGLGIRDHTATTAAIEYVPSTLLRGKAQLLTNNGGREGLWTDWEIVDRRWRHRVGAYHMDPDLLFGDAQPQSDVRGGYWRGEYREGFNNYVVGLESSQTNIRNDPARSGTASDGAYGSLTLRLDRNTTVGAGLSAREERPRQGGAERRNVAVANAFASRQFDFGHVRLDGSYNVTRPERSGRETIRTLNLSHDFPRWNQITASVGLAFTREASPEITVNRRVASLSLRGPLIGSMAWDASVSHVDVEGSDQSERGYNANVSIDWPISANWNAALSWQRNRVQPGPDNPLAPFRQDSTVQFHVRYDFAGGLPYARLSGPGGRQGTGRITGTIFFDENGDGVRQPTERGAENILVVLDGRFPMTTNRDGFYSFNQVALGTRSISIQLERVPLPWGLADESARQVNVTLRDEARLDIGLTRISP